MTEAVLMHDAPLKSFKDAQGVTVDDDGQAEFSWDEVPIVRVDAPADLEGAFDTERFFKVEGATIARPIKQPYHVGDDVETYKKPAEELQKAAWSFDNAPFTLGHPDTGMVKDVNDVHGFWRNVRYVSDDDRLKADLYIPETDEEARKFVSEHQDVSVGFFNRVYSDYEGDTGDLTDEDSVDGYQVDIYGNHVAGVERGRCPSEKGCGLDSMHGRAVMATAPDTHESMDDENITTDGSNLGQVLDTVVTGVTENSDLTRSELISDMASEANVAERTVERYISGDIKCPPASRLEAMASTLDVSAAAFMSALMQDGCNITADTMQQTNDQPAGIFVADGTWFAVGPDEHTKESTEYAEDAMFPVDSCSDIQNAWTLRGHDSNLTIEQSTLAERIQRAAEAKNCDVPGEDSQDDAPETALDAVEGYHPWRGAESDDSDCTTCNDDTMTDDDFDIPDLSIDALAEQNDQVQKLKTERDEYEEAIEDLRDELDLEEDEYPCDVVPDLKEDAERVSDLEGDIAAIKEALGLDDDADVTERVEDIADEWQEMREDKRDERLDRLEELGADRDEWANETLDALDEEIERREEVFDAVDDTSPTGVEQTADDEGEADETTYTGKRRFGRGHAARPEAE